MVKTGWVPKKTEEPIEVRGLVTVDGAKKLINALAGPVKEIIDHAKKIEIKDKESRIVAHELAARAKKLNKDIKQKALELKLPHQTAMKPHQEFVKVVNQTIKMIEQNLEQVWREVDRKAYQYTAQLEAERRRQEKAMREMQEKEQQRLNDMSEKEGIEAPIVKSAPLPEPVKTVRTETGTSYQVENWVAEVQKKPEEIETCEKCPFRDKCTKLPRQYLSIDHKKLNSAVKMGKRDIYEVLIENRPKTRYRV